VREAHPRANSQAWQIFFLPFRARKPGPRRGSPVPCSSWRPLSVLASTSSAYSDPLESLHVLAQTLARWQCRVRLRLCHREAGRAT
jgi:hypothetical protein